MELENLIPTGNFRRFLINLGVANVLVFTNCPVLPGRKFFTDVAEIESANPPSHDFEIVCVDPDLEGGISLDTALPWADKSYRAERFGEGFYLHHYFGAPSALINRRGRFYVVGGNLDRILWAYFVKQLLTVHSIRSGSTHLKAACFELNGNGTLLIGRNGAGKTVFMTQLCLAGASFVSNTHVLVDRDLVVHAVPSSLRVRNDPCFADIIRENAVEEHFVQGEFILEPSSIFGSSQPTSKLKNICIVDYNAHLN